MERASNLQPALDAAGPTYSNSSAYRRGTSEADRSAFAVAIL